MNLKNNWLCYGIFLISFSSTLSASLTTLQSWDPIPFFNAANLNMPPDTPFTNSLKLRMVDDTIDKHRRWGINISPFVQKATRAQQTQDVYFGNSPINGISVPGLPGFEMSDYQGTPYLMGLFLGNAPNGNSIWGGPAALDTGVVTDITTTTVANTGLPSNLQDAINALNNNADAPDYNNALLYYQSTNPPLFTSPSILSQAVLQQDNIFFGAFSVPLAYQKAGFRWELNFDVSDNVGFLARGGFCQITQRAGPSIPLSELGPNSTTTTVTANSSIYSALNTVLNSKIIPIGGTDSSLPLPFAQNTFDEWITNNINSLLDSVNGADYNIETFSEAGIEDIQVLAFARHPFILHPTNIQKHTEVTLTPYIIFGGTIPIAPVRNYSKLYALPFGNNSHPSIGGVAGLTFDFYNSFEFGFEFGATGFLPKTINSLPVPNHLLQRVLYPWREDVTYQPGFNAQFSGVLNAYKFTHNASFSLRYSFVQHTRDKISLLSNNVYFLPDQLEEQSVWSSQMIIGALIFELQPSAYISIAWQGALSQRNAYCSNTILGSLNFQF